MSTVIASGSCVNITSLFTKNLCASLASALSADDDRLCRAATALVFKIAESVKKMPEISPALVPLLNNVKLRAALDLSAAKEIPESIKNAMTAENVHNYLGILKRAFLVEKNPYLEDATGDIRLLYLDSIYDLARTQTHIINDEMIEEYLAFVATQVLFKSTSGTSPSPPIVSTEGKVFSINTNISNLVPISSPR